MAPRAAAAPRSHLAAAAAKDAGAPVLVPLEGRRVCRRCLVLRLHHIWLCSGSRQRGGVQSWRCKVWLFMKQHAQCRAGCVGAACCRSIHSFSTPFTPSPPLLYPPAPMGGGCRATYAATGSPLCTAAACTHTQQTLFFRAMQPCQPHFFPSHAPHTPQRQGQPTCRAAPRAAASGSAGNRSGSWNASASTRRHSLFWLPPPTTRSSLRQHRQHSRQAGKHGGDEFVHMLRDAFTQQ